MKKQIILLGVPRSGTTWLAKILTASGEVTYIHEPDNERHTYSAYYYKRGLERFPYIKKGEENKNYYKLFYNAFHKPYITNGSNSNEILYRLANLTKKKIEFNFNTTGVNKIRLAYPGMLFYSILPKQIKSRNRRLIKSVHSILSAEFILSKFDLNAIVIIRHPAAVISSYLNMDNPDMYRNVYKNERLMKYLFIDKQPDISKLTTKEAIAGFEVALFYKIIHQLTESHPEITLIKHEDLCENPSEESKGICNRLEVNWNKKAENFIKSSNKRGEGYETNRIASEQHTSGKED